MVQSRVVNQLELSSSADNTLQGFVLFTLGAYSKTVVLLKTHLCKYFTVSRLYPLILLEPLCRKGCTGTY